MNLGDYQWFQNPRGLHNSGSFRPLDVSRYLRPRMGWAKLVAGGDEYADEAAELIEGGCIPIVRIARSEMGAMVVPEDWYDIYRIYLNAGVRWFELYDEPNMDHAWPLDPDSEPVVEVSWQNIDECIAPLMDNWIDWAERIVQMGGYPAFPALAENGLPERATVYWMDALLNYLAQEHYERFLYLVENGLWCATHPYLLNHFYQEPPGGPAHAARPHYQQSADEDGWHFEYPYDPILQRHDPGRTVFGATSAAPYGDPQGLIATGEAFLQLLHHRFNVGPVPVVGTAGGITPIPHTDDENVQPDELYPPYSRESHPEAIMALWRWIAEFGPAWFFGLTLTDEAEYYDAQGEVPAIAAMAAADPLIKEVPSVRPDAEIVPELAAPEETVEEIDYVEGTAVEVAGEEAFDLFALDAGNTLDEALEEADIFILDADAQIISPEEEAEKALSIFDLEAGVTPDMEEEYAEEEAVEALPGWLDEGDIAGAPEGISDILLDVEDAGMEMPPPPEIPVEDQLPAGEESDEIPAWLAEGVDEEMASEFVDEDYAEEELESPVDVTADSAIPAWLDEKDIVEPEPVALSDLEEDSEDGLALPPPPVMDLDEELVGEAAEEVPAWLMEDDIEAADVAEAEIETVELPVEEILPGWLSRSDVEEGEPAVVDDLLDVEEAEGLTLPPPPEMPAEEDLVEEAVDEVPSWLVEEEAEVEAVPAGEHEEPVPAPEVAPVAADLPDVAFEEEVPENHWVMLAGAVDPAWFFTAGMRYWDRFRPTLVHGGEDLHLIPEHETVAVTVLATAREIDMVERQILQVRPDARIDSIVCGTLEELTAEFNWRANTGRRFG